GILKRHFIIPPKTRFGLGVKKPAGQGQPRHALRLRLPRAPRSRCSMDGDADSRSLPLYAPLHVEDREEERKESWWRRVVGFKKRRRPREDSHNADQDLYVRTILESYCSSMSSNRFSAAPNGENGGRSSCHALRSARDRYSIDENTYVEHPLTPRASMLLGSAIGVNAAGNGSSGSGSGSGLGCPVGGEISTRRRQLLVEDMEATAAAAAAEMGEADVDPDAIMEDEEQKSRRRLQRRMTHEALKAKLQEKTAQRAHTRRKLLLFGICFGLTLTAFIVGAVIIADNTVTNHEHREKNEQTGNGSQAHDTVAPTPVPTASSIAGVGNGSATNNDAVPQGVPGQVRFNRTLPPLQVRSGLDFITPSPTPVRSAKTLHVVRDMSVPTPFTYVHCLLMSLSLWMSLVVIGMHLTFRTFRTYSLPFVVELSCVQVGYWSTLLLRVKCQDVGMNDMVCMGFCFFECFFNFGQISFTCAIAFNMYRSVVSYAEALLDTHSLKRRYRSYTINVMLLSMLAAMTLTLVGKKGKMHQGSHHEPCLYETSQLILYVYYPLLAFAFNAIFYVRFKRTIGEAYPVSATGRLNKVARSYLVLFFVCWGSVISLTALQYPKNNKSVPIIVKYILQSIFDVLGVGTAIITITNFQRCRKAFDFGLSLKAVEPTSIEFEEPINILGEGTFALVLKAKWHQGVSDNSVPRTIDVAVKTFKHTQFESLDQMKEEAYLASKLVHPCVMMTYGCYTTGNNLYIVSEYLGGGTLQDIIDTHDFLSYGLVLRYAHMIAMGMRFLHGLPVPIIHRDLKPLNCIFDSDQEMLKLADFGESRLFRKDGVVDRKAKFFPSVDLTLQMTTNIGSACWAAPEVLKDEATSEYSLKIDVYSFGIICWQLYTCKVPYVDIPGSVLAVAEAVLDGRRPEIPSDCPSLFAKIMRRCWHEDPLRRPSFEDIVQLLELEMDDERKKLATSSSRRVLVVEDSATVALRRISLREYPNNYLLFVDRATIYFHATNYLVDVAKMIPDQHPVVQALLGTLVTWGLTALGAALVFVLDVENKETSQKILDGMLGFAGGVMLAASYWSLLAPAIEIAEESELYGPDGRWAFVPAAVGFALGAATLFAAEKVLPWIEGSSGSSMADAYAKKDDDFDLHPAAHQHVAPQSSLRQRKPGNNSTSLDMPYVPAPGSQRNDVDAMASFGVHKQASSFRRVLLLVIAITLHNFPEGMAVGVGFGSIGHSPSASFGNAVNLAIGIGLQNFPEGLAVSMPLRREGMSPFKAFMWGQLSGLVEPLGGLIGAAAVMYVQPILPYALSFAAGAMIFVVVDDLIPEANQSGNQKLSTFGVIVGFIVMMTMDVALG
ncbi:TPA: hypothetical protein N0F65_000033, partial [Lagenidium giganteum]